MKKILLILLALTGAMGILLVSVSRATLDLVIKEEMEGRLRIEPVMMGDRMIYKLPQTGILPGNVFYRIKESRNWLWQKFSFGKEKEAKIALILADKKMAEAKALLKKGNYNLALKTSMRAVDKLKYAYTLSSEIRNGSLEKKLILDQIREATLAYETISIELKNEKIIETINDFKKEQIQKEIPPQR